MSNSQEKDTPGRPGPALWLDFRIEQGQHQNELAQEKHASDPDNGKEVPTKEAGNRSPEKQRRRPPRRLRRSLRQVSFFAGTNRTNPYMELRHRLDAELGSSALTQIQDFEAPRHVPQAAIVPDAVSLALASVGMSSTECAMVSQRPRSVASLMRAPLVRRNSRKTAAQVTALHAAFLLRAHETPDDRRRLSRDTGLSETSIRTWFYRARENARKRVDL